MNDLYTTAISDLKGLYALAGWITGLVMFVGCWIYAAMTYGLFLGGGFGWIPALVLGFIAGWTWPLWLVLACVAVSQGVRP